MAHRPRSIGVLIPYQREARQRLTDPFFRAMLASLADAITARGMHMLFWRVDAAELDTAAAPFDIGRVAGIIVIGQWRHHEQLNQLAGRGVPLVVWGAQLPSQQYCTVGSDNVGGGRLATEHLLRLGRRQIAFFGDINLPEVEQRHLGYTQALARIGIEADPMLRISTSFLADGGQVGVEELQARHVDYDALFCCSDLMASGAIAALRRLRVRVPQDVAVVGYDDVDLAAHAAMPISTIHQPIDAGAEALVASLLERLDGLGSGSVILPTELVRRESAP